MAQTYYYHTDPKHEVRIKVTAKMVTWEEKRTTNLDAVIAGADPIFDWKFYMRRPLPVNNAEALREMYNLPNDVVSRLKGQA
jgi:hypothetical protein